jgi:hypothetical protein
MLAVYQALDECSSGCQSRVASSLARERGKETQSRATAVGSKDQAGLVLSREHSVMASITQQSHPRSRGWHTHRPEGTELASSHLMLGLVGQPSQLPKPLQSVNAGHVVLLHLVRPARGSCD